jgi:DNA polymerase (family 10)
MKNREVADALLDLSRFSELLGEDWYRAVTYREASENVRRHSSAVEDLAAKGRLGEVPGVGPAIAAKIAEYLETGRIEAVEERRAKIPPATLALLEIPGFGPARAVSIPRHLRIWSVTDLRHAAESGALASVPRVGPKLAARVLEALDRGEPGT